MFPVGLVGEDEISARPPMPIMQISFSQAGHFHSGFLICVFLPPPQKEDEDEDEVAFPCMLLFRFLDGGQNGVISSNGEDYAEWSLLRRFS
jgi:hypothetical protein